jgi:hypothetical protein
MWRAGRPLVNAEYKSVVGPTVFLSLIISGDPQMLKTGKSAKDADFESARQHARF